MQNSNDILGDLIKSARRKAGITMEALADKIGITERYLYRIENEGQKPSFDILYKLIRELAIPADSVFYPEKRTKSSETEQLIYLLYQCNESSQTVLKATINALIANQQKE